MATSRTRTMITQGPRTGYWDHGGGGFATYSESVKPKSCKDVIGNLTGTNPLEIISYSIDKCYIYTVDDEKITANFPVSSIVLYATWVNNLLNSADIRNRTLSQTGPLTPNIYLPLSVFELRDLPKMIKWIGDTLLGLRPGRFRPYRYNPARLGAEATLAYQFGWAPLIQDMIKMMNFVDAVKKRQEYLRKAHSIKGVRRRINLGTTHSSSGGSSAINSTWGLNMAASWHNITTTRHWSTIRWTVRDQSQIGRSPSFSEAFKTTLGLQRGHIPIMLWKALPWSWCIDWFADISNILQANYNMIYYKPDRLCYMAESVSTKTWHPIQNGRFLFEGGTATEVRKTRSPLSATTSLSLRLPFMDAFKLSIVGSMSTLKLLRKLR